MSSLPWKIAVAFEALPLAIMAHIAQKLENADIYMRRAQDTMGVIDNIALDRSNPEK